jgi:phage gpG-like protein
MFALKGGIAMFNIQFNVGATRAALRRAIAAMEDATPMYEDIAEYMVDAHRQRWQSKVAPDGTAWAPKKQSTLDRYKARGYANLTDPLTGPSGRLLREVQRYVSSSGVVIGSSLIYAGVMHGGAAKGAFGADRHGRPIPWGTIRARPMFGISAEDAEAIIEIAEDYARRHLDSDG